MGADDLPERVAAGFVLFRDTAGARQYLVLTNAKRGEPGLPKGHAERGEAPLQTAHRETLEETGLEDLEVWGDFTQTLHYDATRRGRRYKKRVVYFLARARSGTVRISPEHSQFAWRPLDEAIAAMPHEGIRETLRNAGLFSKDPKLFEMEPIGRRRARAHLESLPHCTKRLVRHLRGGARLARAFAKGLIAAGIPANVRATGTGTLLHDVGRALGQHEDHPRQGLIHLRRTVFAPYGFACVSHFTKGAPPEALLQAGVSAEQVADFQRLIDIHRMTWEERCAALADACMKGDTAVSPRERFADLRNRYGKTPIIDLQERRTKEIRAELREALGRDPLKLVDLD